VTGPGAAIDTRKDDRMRRRFLATTMALGLVITAMGFTGIYAVFHDTATTGTNHADSGTQPSVADLVIADGGTDMSPTCSGVPYDDDLATGIFNVSNLQPGGGSGYQWVCLQNVGTAALDLSAYTIDVSETETGCTGDESQAGDATCGTAGVGDGELGTVLQAHLQRFDCNMPAGPTDQIDATIEALTATGSSLGSLPASSVACILVNVAMFGIGPDATADELQRAQSDQVEWRFAFDGTAS
jgi:hypothetical protein